MARHRHIRCLDISEEYENQFYHEDSDENSFLNHLNEGDSCDVAPSRSLLFDFIEEKIEKNSDGCSEVSEKRRKCIRKVEMFESPKTAVSTRDKAEFKPIRKRELVSIENSLEKSRIEQVSQLPLPKELTYNKTEKRLTNRASARSTLAMQEYESRNSLSKKPINIIVIGHVDAGKSTLFGNLLVKLGYESGTIFRKQSKEDQVTTQYAWLLDEMPEERQRGITMDIAYRRIRTSEREVVLLDSPGHKDFIANMITGATEADSAILVIDANVGKFEAGFELGGQTKEHVLLARSLGIFEIIVAVNKMDSIGWERKRYVEIVDTVTSFLKSIGFRKYIFLPCSGLLGVNIAGSSRDSIPWYDGFTLLGAINQLEPPKRCISKPLRMFISDFTENSKGLTVSGRITCGHVQHNDKVVIMPSNTRCNVVNIVTDTERRKYAFGGDLVDLQISGIDAGMINVSKGDVICCSSSPIKPVSTFRAKLLIFNIVLPLTKGTCVQLHYQGIAIIGVVTKLLALLQKNDGKVLKAKPRFLPSNSCANVEISVTKPICIEPYEQSKELGRFLLRSDSNTIAAGIVTELLDQSI